MIPALILAAAYIALVLFVGCAFGISGRAEASIEARRDAA